MGNEVPKSGETAQPHFMQANEMVAGIFQEWGIAHGKLSRAAQSFDFVLSQDMMPEDTITTNAVRLAGLIDSSDAPQEIRAVYEQLYGEQLAQILGSRRQTE